MQRRNFLGGVAAGLGLLAVPRDSRAEAAQQRFLLIVFAQGAWDVTYALDPKQAPGCDVPAGKVTSYGHGIKVLTDPSRPSVGNFFAANASRCAVVNGLWIGSVAHAPARIRVLTGTRSERNPDVGAIFAASAAEKQPSLPLPYVDLGGGAYAGPLASVMGRVGSTNQLVTLIDRKKAFRGASEPVVLADAEQAALAEFAARRAGAAAQGPGGAALASYTSSLGRAATLRRDPQLRGMSVGKATTLAQQGALAVEQSAA